MLDGVVWTEWDISTRFLIWSVESACPGMVGPMAAAGCIGMLLVFCGSCAVVVVDGPESSGMARTGLGISIRFAIWSVDSADSTNRRVDALSEVYADHQNSSARAAMLVDQSVARGCREATNGTETGINPRYSL